MVKCALTLWIVYPKQDVTLDGTLAKKYKQCILEHHCDITVKGYISYSIANTLCTSENGEDVSYKITVNLDLYWRSDSFTCPTELMKGGGASYMMSKQRHFHSGWMLKGVILIWLEQRILFGQRVIELKIQVKENLVNSLGVHWELFCIPQHIQHSRDLLYLLW